MNRKLISIAILALVTTACTQESVSVENSDAESKILLSSHSASIAINKDIPVRVWADRKSGDAYFNAWELTSDDQGNLNPAGDNIQYFPDGNEKLNLYALYGNFVKNEFVAGVTPFPVQGLPYEVYFDQQKETDYKRSDLLYAVQNNVGRQDGNISLRFYHMLSKVEILLNPGGGVTAEELRHATVMIDAVRGGNFTPQKVTDTEMADYSVRSSMIGVPEGASTRIYTTPKVMGDDDMGTEYGGCAILFPQTVKERTFITIALPDRRVYIYTPKELILESGKHYTFRLTPDNWILKATLEVEDWRNGGSVTTHPDLLDKLTIDAATELPEGAEINQTQDVLTMNHLPAEFTLAVSCGNELEFVPDPGLPLTVERLTETVWNGYSQFRITKTLIPPNFPEEKTVLRFRRKGLAEVYKEDVITLVSRKNPIIIEGNMVFDRNTYTFNFGKYIEGEMSVIELPQGKDATLTVEQGEDIWAKLDTPAGQPAKRRILGGWKPNDPKADGREQSVTLTVSDADGSNPERYTIKRQNWGLPVVNIGDTWWCKYNLRGTGTNFADQILLKDDPSPESSPYAYLQNCAEGELLGLLGLQYQGGYPQGLPLDWDAEKSVFYYRGMKTSAEGFHEIEDAVMVPSGYRLPRYEDYQVLTESDDFDLGGPGTTKTYTNPQKKTVTSSVSIRDVSFLGHHYGYVGFYEFQVGNAGDKIVLCGLGHQSAPAHGNLLPMYILLATVNQQHSWAIVGEANAGRSQENRFRLLEGLSVKRTRTMRCIKTPVEYMY